MTSENDRLLIEEARKIKLWNWPDVYHLIPDADSEETKETLRNIAAMLYDHNLDGRV